MESKVEQAIEKAIAALSNVMDGYAPTVTQIRDARGAIHGLMKLKTKLKEYREYQEEQCTRKPPPQPQSTGYENYIIHP